MTSTNQSIVLTVAEAKQCHEIKEQQQNLAQKRAIALLFINEGKTYPQAATESSLTIGQIRYLVTSFKRIRMELFNKKSTTSKAKTATTVKTSSIVSTSDSSEQNTAEGNKVEEIRTKDTVAEKSASKTKVKVSNKKDNKKSKKNDKKKKNKKKDKKNKKKK